MDPLTPDVMISLSERARELEDRPLVAAFYQDGDLGSAILLTEDGSVVDALAVQWADGRWSVIPDDPPDFTVAAAAGSWPGKVEGDVIRGRIAGRDVAIPVGRDGEWTFVARVPDIRQPGCQLEFPELEENTGG